MPLNQPAGDLIWSSLNSFKLLGWQHRLRKSMREKWRVALPRSHQSGQRRLGWSLSSLWSAVRYLAPAPGLENISPPGGQAALISGFASALKVAVAMARLNGKESTCKLRKCRFDPWVGKNPQRRKWQPTPVFMPGKSHWQRSLVGYKSMGSPKSQMQLSD